MASEVGMKGLCGGKGPEAGGGHIECRHKERIPEEVPAPSSAGQLGAP